MDELPCWKDNYCAAPICLLYVNSNMELIPIAIQLKRKPAADNPIFLPTDCRTDWILAKMYFSNASAQVITSLSEIMINFRSLLNVANDSIFRSIIKPLEHSLLQTKNDTKCYHCHIQETYKTMYSLFTFVNHK